MKDFRNILFVAHGQADQTNALKQALSLSRNNEAPLTALIVIPALPDSLGDSKKIFSDALVDKLKSSIEELRKELKIGESVVDIRIRTEESDTPDISIIRYVLRNENDLVIKEAQPIERGKGFKAVDMQLLRKCPCPVWLSRPIINSRAKMNVAVAIDPMDKEGPGRSLALGLLQTARSLADQCSGTLEVTSCWYYEYEESVRDNPWFSTATQS
ncbi:MAG: universal stress protein [Owenweeksia sp.]|nr:universal stress protein [Owenweeksia sp.]